ncbi:MAG: hypothetical protein OEW58_03725 [Gammaproteobacteria bacterium]|nr:hypothetical protein [Gammaproteobacteria bacterium]
MDREKERSLTQNDEGFTVAASPFNAVKVELAIILILGVVLFAWHPHLTTDEDWQLLILAGYGVVSAAWLVLRVKRVEKVLAVKRGEEEKQ